MENKPQRRSPRLRDYDYRQNGAYFITICTHRRRYLFGQVVDDAMRLSAIGELAEAAWTTIPDHFPFMELDAFAVMPNHVHGLVVITSDSSSEYERRTRYISSLQPGSSPKEQRANGATAGSLGVIVASYKAAVTRAVNRTIDKPPRPLWQERYYDHVVRNEEELNRISDYIVANPSRWQEDSLYQPM